MGASLVWLHASLQSLDKSLRSRYGPGAGIIFRTGPYLEALKDVAAKADARCIHYSRRCKLRAAWCMPAVDLSVAVSAAYLAASACHNGL